MTLTLSCHPSPAAANDPSTHCTPRPKAEGPERSAFWFWSPAAGEADWNSASQLGLLWAVPQHPRVCQPLWWDSPLGRVGPRAPQSKLPLVCTPAYTQKPPTPHGPWPPRATEKPALEHRTNDLSRGPRDTLGVLLTANLLAYCPLGTIQMWLVSHQAAQSWL